MSKPVPPSLAEFDFTPVCEAIDRFNYSAAGSAMIMNSIFEMTGYISPGLNGLVVTPNYMANRLAETRKKTWKESVEARRQNVEHIQCFSFDGKKNDNAIIIEKVHGRNMTKQDFIQLENVAILRQPDLEPLGFISTVHGTSSFIFQKIWDFLNPDGNQSFESLIAIASDGANVNTGSTSGIIRLFEEKLKRNLHWIICMLHLNELGLKHVICAVDGPTTSDSKLSGPTGKKITSVDFMPTNVARFLPIPTGKIPPGLAKMAEHFRGDQRLMMDLAEAIATGQCSEEIAFRNIPPFSLCRWTSGAIRIQKAYISDDQPSENLVTLVTYVQQVYIPMWVRVRLQDSWQYGSRHLFDFLDSARVASKMCNNEILISKIQSVIVNNGYFGHCENILLCMLADSDAGIRKTAYSRILKIRNQLSNGQPQNMLRRFEKPKREEFDFKAKDYTTMLKAEKFIYEPPFIQNISTRILKERAEENQRLRLPKFKLHTQDTERMISVMNSCVGRVAGIENQNAILKHKVMSRKKNPRIVKKKYQTYAKKK